ncbi:hypothetical protein BC827DRAFT_1199999 [Russula dissimulans]|nr:hypothetical protein BC827DRAFT_1199999 [Russula dissimulans]
MSYYPDHVYRQSPSTLTPTSTPPSLRKCSVKGCAKDLSPDYPLKMCDTCRGRHRKYATTKRAKRKQEKAALGAQRIGNDDGRVVTWMPQDHHVSLGPIPEDLDPVQNMHLNQIDPRLFNPTSSELAGALTLPPLDSSSDAQDPMPSPVDGASPSPSSCRSPGQSRYCSVKGCRSVIGGDYLFKMCVPCRDRYRGYGMTKRSKSKRGREIAAQELKRVRAEEDVRRAQQGLPLIGELQVADRRAWERKVLDAIPSPPVVQYAPISLLPVRMCTVSHCHTMLQGHYPYRRCERHRLQNRHHSKLKRVRDKEVKSTPLRNESTQDTESVEGAARKGQTRAIDPYSNDPLNLDAEVEGTEVSEHEDTPDESAIPPPARGARRSNTVCSVKWCQNVLYFRSPWKMCEPHREKDRMNRRRKASRDKSVAEDLDEEQADPDGDHSAVPGDIGSDGEPAGAAETPTSTTEPPVVFMEPLLPPKEPPSTTTMPQQSELFDYPIIPPQVNPSQVNPLLPYGSGLSQADVLADVTPDPNVSGPMGIEGSSEQCATQGSTAEGHHVDHQETSLHHHGQQDISSMVWESDMSPLSTGDTNSIPSQSTPSSSTRPTSTVTADMSSSPVATTVTATPVSTTYPGPSTSSSHIQPQFQVPYYIPPPFSVSYTPRQPPFLVPRPYPAMSYPPRPSYTYSAPVPNPYQTFQYAPPCIPYPFPAWGTYTSGPVDANRFDASAQAQTQMVIQGQGRAQPKRARAAAAEDGLRIVLVQPKGSLVSDSASASASATLTSTSGAARTTSDPSPSPLSSSTVNSPHTDATGPATPADSATRVCSSEACRRRLPNGAQGSLCERCKTRLKKRQEKTRLRLKLEPRKARFPSRRLET